MEVFSTDAIPPPQRLEYWRLSIERKWTRFDVDCSSMDKEQFHARLNQKDAGPAKVYELDTNGHDIYRPRQRASQKNAWILL